MPSVTLDDGTLIAYSLHGSERAGAPPFVLTNGLTTDTLFWRHLIPEWGRRHRIVTWDLPGHGQSGPAQSDASATIIGQPAILQRVMGAAGVERAVQVGWSTGSQVVLELYRTAPARCLALVSLLGSAGRVLDTARLPLPGPVIDGLAQRMPQRVFEGAAFALTRVMNTRVGHALGRRLGLLGPDASRQDVRAITEHMTTLHPATVQRMLHSAQEQSAHDLLCRIEVPMLIVCGDVDPFAPAETVGVPMHEAVEGSELLRLPRGTHTALLDHPLQIGEAVESFVVRRCC